MSDTVFDEPHHICIVVRDLDRSVAFYESIGIGPWQDFPSLEAFRDKADLPSDDFFDLRYQFANLGGLQLQLCEPPVGETPQRAFLDAHGEGVFHIGFTVPDLAGAEANVIALGLSTMMRAQLDNGAGFSYFDTVDRGAGVTLEIRASAT